VSVQQIQVEGGCGLEAHVLGHKGRGRQRVEAGCGLVGAHSMSPVMVHC